MLRSVSLLNGYSLLATDGPIGWVKDGLFDDHRWTLRYLVVDVGTWLPDRRVLISPLAIEDRPHWESHTIPVRLSKKQVQESPDIKDQLVDTNAGKAYSLWSTILSMIMVPAGPAVMPPPYDVEEPNLRSASKLSSYQAFATDAEVGKVEDLIVDDETWRIVYLVVDITPFEPERKVLISPDWVDTFDWTNAVVRLTSNSDLIKQSPAYDPSQLIDRAQENALYDYYRRPKYWEANRRI